MFVFNKAKKLINRKMTLISNSIDETQFPEIERTITYVRHDNINDHFYIEFDDEYEIKLSFEGLIPFLIKHDLLDKHDEQQKHIL